MKHFPLLTLLLFGLLLISSCSSTVYPAITSSPTNEYRYGEAVWRDLITIKPAETVEFYSDLFGWEIEKTNEGDIDYYTIKHGDDLIGGIVYSAERTEDKGSEWVTLISVQSIDQAVTQVRENGGTVYGRSFNVPGRGEVAMVSDPSQAYLGLIHAEDGDPIAREPGDGDWMWTELWSDDPDRVISFYEGFGLTVKETTKEGNDYYTFNAGDEVVASMLKSPIENWRSLWVPYVRVSDAGMMAEKAEAAGGKVVMAPTPEVRNSTVAVVMDPGGAIVVLQEWQD